MERQKMSRPTNRRRSKSSARAHGRRLRIEPLEDRRLLAVLTVNSPLDNTTSGNGLVTLREAIVAANADGTTDLGQQGSGADTIEFDAGVFRVASDDHARTGPAVAHQCDHDSAERARRI